MGTGIQPKKIIIDMPLIKRVADVFLFPTGMLAVCDVKGEQIGELQGPYSIEKHRRIRLEALESCNYHGFNILPEGFAETVNNWIAYWYDKNLSWDEINAL